MKGKVNIALVLVIILFSNIINASNVIEENDDQNSDGFILYAPIFSRKTFIVDKTGCNRHVYKSNFFPADSVFLKDNGNIIRSIIMFPHPNFLIMSLGTGGGLQEIAPNGSVIWNYRYFGKDFIPHHDIHLMSNGNILLLCWEIKKLDEIIQAGRNPYVLEKNVIWAEYIIEVEPVYPFGGNIVWQWHVWDHLIQDYDPGKDNFGIVKNHPELVDINAGHNNEFWTHGDAIDYNENLDQIMITVNNFNEIWVIDHNTTTKEASGHNGGKHGKGGDILYRWGNPQTYRCGNENDQILYGPHDGRWIEPNIPGRGNILIFNNGEGRIGTKFSTVIEIVPPIDKCGNYIKNQNETYGPIDPIWLFKSENPKDFYCAFSGSAQRLPNGNTLICNGFSGEFFEVNNENEIIWEYINKHPFRLLNPIYSHYEYPRNHLGIQNLIKQGLI